MVVTDIWYYIDVERYRRLQKREADIKKTFLPKQDDRIEEANKMKKSIMQKVLAILVICGMLVSVMNVLPLSTAAAEELGLATATDLVPAEETEIEETTEEETVTEESAAEEPAAEEIEEIVPEEVAEETEDDGEEFLDIEDYETPLGIIGQHYAFERDENGALVLDEKGNPVVIPASEEDDVPVAFLRDEEGALILDENGNPIVTQTVPANAVIINTLEDALDPNRSIDIYYSWDNGEVKLGGSVTFIAVLHGYDNLDYTVQWQESADDVNWSDIQDANSLTNQETITAENYRNFWRVQVTITGVI